ncbi:MAG: hypothetical protein RIC15_06395 [Vicingaceae bacterium]
MRRIPIITIFIFFAIFSHGQRITVLSTGSDSDSSFYHLSKIDLNEFWAGGEMGVLKRIDSTGQISHIQYPNQGLNILTIKRIHDYVYILTDNAVIYRYSIPEGVFITKNFKGFKNKCFYDLIAMEDGSLLVCGGTSGISKGAKKIPKGYIATIDADLNEIDFVWKNNRKFVWSLSETSKGHLLASSFNGFNTTVIKRSEDGKWRKFTKIKGLVHELKEMGDDLWYSGTEGIRYKKNGMVGIVGADHWQTAESGCQWSMESMDDHVITVSYQSKLFVINKENHNLHTIQMPSFGSLYDIERISNDKLLVIGHAKGVFLVDFQAIPEASTFALPNEEQ